MRNIILLFCFTLLTQLAGFAQGSDAQRYEFGPTGGLAYYIGDMNQVHFNNSKLSGGLVFKANMNKRISLRGSFLYARLNADDAEALNLNQVNRNLNFKSQIFELGGMVEINFFDYLAGEFKRFLPYTPYVFFGLTYFHHNPKGRYNDDYVELQPLGTEGQETSYNSDNKYNLNQIAIPFGVGIKASLTKHLAIAIEYGVRKTYTDYLDDISGTYADPTILINENGSLAYQMADQSLNQEGLGANNTGVKRGDPNTKDWYMYSGITLTYLFGRESSCKQNFSTKRWD